MSEHRTIDHTAKAIFAASSVYAATDPEYKPLTREEALTQARNGLRQEVTVLVTEALENLEQFPKRERFSQACNVFLETLKVLGLDAQYGYDKAEHAHDDPRCAETFTLTRGCNVFGCKRPAEGNGLCCQHQRPKHTPPKTLDDLQREEIIEAIDSCDGVKTKAAERLKVHPSYLYHEMKRLGISGYPTRALDNCKQTVNNRFSPGGESDNVSRDTEQKAS